MPSGTKKGKAAKRKNHHHQQQRQQESPKSPKGDGKGKDLVVVEDEGEEEVFETPRSRPGDEFEGSSEANATGDEKLEESVVAAENSNGLHHEIPLEEESLKDVKLDKLETEEFSDSIDEVGASSFNGREAKVVRRPKEEKPTDYGDAIVDVEVVHSEKGDEDDAIEKEVRNDECLKEIILENFGQEKEHHVPVTEIRNGEDLKEKILENLGQEKEHHVPVTEIRNGKGLKEKILENMGQEKDYHVPVTEIQNGEGLKEKILESLGQEKEQCVPITENFKVVMEPVQVLPHIDEDLTEKEQPIPVGNSDVVFEESRPGTKLPHENHENSIGATVALAHGEVKEAEEPFLDAKRTEIVQRNEVARGPLVVRHAAFWNCCCLLDLFTGSDR